MFLAYLILTLLLLAAPLTVISSGLSSLGLITLVVALLLTVIALQIRTVEINFLAPIIYPVAIFATIPALWMLFQILPLKAIGLANPIWESAATALGRSIGGSVSIDIGATIIALVRYLSMVAISLAAAAVATDRRRAEGLLSVLTASATTIALMKLTTVVDLRDAATVCSALGVILAATGIARVMERRRMRGENRRDLVVWFWLSFAGYFVALAICLLAIPAAADSQTLFALACGVATFIVAIVIRKFHMGPWGYSAIIAVGLVVAIAVITFQPATRTLGLTLAFASQAPRSLVTLTQRILSETGWAGTGAGTFAAVLPIYQDLDELTNSNTAPNALSAIAIEMGRPFLLAISAAATALIVTFLHAAAHRGRDSFYSTAGASCIVAVVLLAFGSAAVLSTPATIILAAIIGVAIAQSKGRSI